MIWNPWKEIKRLREELHMVKYHLDLATMEENTVRECWVQTDQRLHAVRDVLDKIGLEEKTTSNATVKRICRMAHEGLQR
jgi:hypothetical protein